MACVSQTYVDELFLSTLPARGATHSCVFVASFIGISIHAPREGSDSLARCIGVTVSNFYPRSPRGERLTHSRTARSVKLNFYPRSPRGERRQVRRAPGDHQAISIHAPREGSDPWPHSSLNFSLVFLSTLPARGATAPQVAKVCHHVTNFYPRSPRGERRMNGFSASAFLHFYPRSPRGERQQMC